MVKVPINYLEWCNLFDEITNSPRDEEYIEAIKRGVISWTSGVAERYIKAASEMIRKRVNSAHDRYQRQMKNAQGLNSNISNALSALNKEYRYVYSIAKALPIPEEYREQIAKSVKDQANQTQASLEDSAKADRSGHLLSMVKNAHVNRIE